MTDLAEVTEIAEEVDKRLDQSLQELEKRFGVGSMSTLDKRPPREYISTGLLSLDKIMGGGFPRGQIIEIFGPESGGKSTLALETVREAQKLGMMCAYFDTEGSLNSDLATLLGVDTSQLLAPELWIGEHVIDATIELIKSETVGLIVVDSIAGLVTAAESESEAIDQHMGLHPKMIAKFMKYISLAAAYTKTTVLCLNQVRAKFGGYGNPEITPGGFALKHHANLRIRIGRGKPIMKGKVRVGQEVRASIHKNKIAAPWQETTYHLYYGKGSDKVNDIMETATSSGVIERRGGWYYYKAEKFQGAPAVVNYLKKNADALSDIKRAVMGEDI